MMKSSDLSNKIADSLAEANVDRVFGIPGGGNNLDFVSAAKDRGMSFVLAHQETNAAIMAAVYGDLTSTPGVCLVTRGPGAANVINGVANAQLDRQALMIITDAVSSADAERIAHQRLDQPALFSPLTKWSGTIGLRGNTDFVARRSVAKSMESPRGAVHLDFDPAAQSSETIEASTSSPTPNTTDLNEAKRLIAAARRPVVLLGVGARDLSDSVRTLLAESNVPVLMTYRAKGVIPSSWSSDAGLLSGATTEAPVLKAADLLVLIGLDSVELIPAAWDYNTPVVSFAEWAETTSYIDDVVEVVGELPQLLDQLQLVWPESDWLPNAGNSHRDFELERLRSCAVTREGAVSPQSVVDVVRREAPKGTVATVDAGAHMFPATSLWSVENPDEMLISSGLATMGFALPAAVAAALARPERHIVCFVGDGGIGMCATELETLSRLQLKVTVIVFNDASLSLIAIKAKPGQGGSREAVNYDKSDYARIAEGYGVRGFHAKSERDLGAAIRSALERTGPSLIDTHVDPSGYPAIMAAIRGNREEASSPIRSAVQRDSV